MKLFVAILMMVCMALPALALDYTVSVQVEADRLTEAQGEALMYGELFVGTESIATSKEQTLTLTPGALLPVSLVFEDVEAKLAEALVQTPTAEVTVVYSYKPTASATPIRLATQRVPAVAYASIADSVREAVGNFTVQKKLTATETTIAVKPASDGNEMKSQLLLSHSSAQETSDSSQKTSEQAHTIDTFSGHQLTLEEVNLGYQSTKGKETGTERVGSLKVSGVATLFGETEYFEGLSGAGIMPVGAIVMTTTKLSNSCWQLCDGKKIEDKASRLVGYSTPNLVNRFLRGTDNNEKVNKMGGQSTVTLTGANLPAHTHYYKTTDPQYRHVTFDNVSEDDSGGDDWINHKEDHPETAPSETSKPSTSTGNGEAFSIVPPYYTVYFYLKIK